jgi:multiple antibiotic resistance protein
MTLYTATLMLLLVMDPIGNIPVFLAALVRVDPKRRKMIIMRELAIALLVLVFFLFFGRSILTQMHLSSSALGIAGGAILLILALKMIFPSYNLRQGGNVDEEPFIVPLAIHMVAGPASMAMIMLISTQHSGHDLRWLLALFIAWLASVIILVSSEFLRMILRERGIIALERLMGMLLLVLGVQMLLNGLQQFFHLQ